jgi:hypothetical protein
MKIIEDVFNKKKMNFSVKGKTLEKKKETDY